jgi:hypothetical protein
MVQTRNARSLIASSAGCNNYVAESVYNDMELVLRNFLHQFTGEVGS